MRSDMEKVLGVCAAVVACTALADPARSAVTYSYTGLPFTFGVVAGHIEATVTFDDSVVGSTGTVDGSSVVAWSIRAEGVSGSELTSATGFLNGAWPLYFVFDAGVITGWQLLAETGPSGTLPQLYTTHNSPFASILSTADTYYASGTLYGYNDGTPGSWRLVAVPEPIPEPVLGGLLLAGGWAACAGIAGRRKSPKANRQSA